jgi:hypothetical protein
MPSLDEYSSRTIARLLGVDPEDITSIFIHEMRKKMQRDPMYGTPLLDLDESDTWLTKCKTWAQEVLRDGPTPCTAD